MKKLNVLLLVLFISATVFAQIEMPQPSPTATLEQRIGLTDVKIVYSRPGMKERKIFGDLVPFGEMWRTGANSSTKITFSDKVMINNSEVPAGTYALYTIPNKDEWTIILHKNTKLSGTGGADYKMEEDQMRFNVKTRTLNDKVETFTIDINNNKNDASTVALSWESTMVGFEVQAPVKEKVEAMIKRTLNPGGVEYYRAATYFHDSGNPEKALEHINIALTKYESDGSKPYWVARRKSLIQADLKQYKEAIKTAEMSLAWAKEQSNNDYVKMNEASIAEWKKK